MRTTWGWYNGAMSPKRVWCSGTKQRPTLEIVNGSYVIDVCPVCGYRPRRLRTADGTVPFHVEGAARDPRTASERFIDETLSMVEEFRAARAAELAAEACE